MDINIGRKVNRINHDMAIIVEKIIAKMKEPPDAIYLCGGYGRDEGAWLLNADGTVSPYNDYDFTVIANIPLTDCEYKQLRQELATLIGISWIDIDFYSPKELHKMTATIKNIDLLYASKLLFGKDMLKELPTLHSKQIGVYDALNLYKTRIWTFLGSWSGSFRALGSQESCFFKNQMAKATLAACDMVLIREHMYTPKYSERVKRACQIMSDKAIFCTRAEWALNEKLHPSMQTIDAEEMKKMYFECKDIFDLGMSYVMGNSYNYLLVPDKTKKYFLFHTTYLLHNTYNKMFRKSKKIEKRQDMFLAQNYVYRANDKGNINEEYLESAMKLLKKWNYVDSDVLSWNEIHLIVANARNNI